MELGGNRGDTEQAIGHLLAIGPWVRLDDQWSSFAAKPETNYLYGEVVWWAEAAMNVRPTARPWTLPNIFNWTFQPDEQIHFFHAFSYANFYQ